VKAYRLNPPGGARAWEPITLPDPAPGPGEVLVGVRATSLNYREIMIATGTYPIPPKQDCIPVGDGAGEVLAVGEGVSSFKVGDRVAAGLFQTWTKGQFRAADYVSSLGASIDGMLAEKVVLRASGLVAVPPHLSYEEAATLPCAALTAWHAVMESGAHLQPGATVLTLGTGGVSLFAIQLARAAGCQVIATSSSDEKLGRLSALGATHGVNYRTHPSWWEEVKRLTGGAGADLIVEVAGSTLNRSLEAVAFGGTVSVIGSVGGSNDEPFNARSLYAKCARMYGVAVGSLEMFERMNRAIGAHRIRPVIDSVHDFDRANDALLRLQSGAHFGKVVIRV
jgi:NADPH:quinone reductase-like Zn-dependent oxidoreductase